MVQRDDDEAWRSIVDNYGERAEVDPDPPVSDAGTDTWAGPAPDASGSPSEPTSDSWTVQQPQAQPARSWDDAYPDADWTTDRFVPPPPPPLPRPRRDRLIAWLGVFGSPAVLLVCLVLGIGLPELVAYVLVAGFVGGFAYLVLLMPRGPRDPDDDGAVL